MTSCHVKMVEPNSPLPLLGEDELTLFDVYRLRIFLHGWRGQTPPQIPHPAGTAPLEPELWRDQLRQEKPKNWWTKLRHRHREVEGNHKETFEV